MLLTIFPATVVLPSVRPSEDSLSFFLVVDVLSLVLAAILKRETPVPVHHVVSPIALILTAVNPCVGAGALHLVQNETALEGASILES